MLNNKQTCPLSNRSTAYDSHSNAVLHRGAQHIINRARDNTPRNTDNRFNQRSINETNDETANKNASIEVQEYLLGATKRAHIA